MSSASVPGSLFTRAAPEIAIELDQVAYAYPGQPLLSAAISGVTLQIRRGELCALIGPNGSGKSTLVGLMARTLDPVAGSLRLLGTPSRELDRRAIAERVALVPQRTEIAFGFSVREVVLMGRAPHQGGWMRATKRDQHVVDRAIELCDLAGVQHRPANALSGGEQKRVALARALVQEAPILLLDEVSAHLDMRHVLELYELVRSEAKARNAACVLVVHDLHAAAKYADTAVLVKAGEVRKRGPAMEVLQKEPLEEVFDVELSTGVTENTQYFVPLRPRSRPSSRRGL